MKSNKPHCHDISIGRKIHFRREKLGMSQKQLGHLQKYERGQNRIGAGRLQEVADILDVPIFFFIPISQQKKMPHTMVMKQSLAKRNICSWKILESLNLKNKRQFCDSFLRTLKILKILLHNRQLLCIETL